MRSSPLGGLVSIWITVIMWQDFEDDCFGIHSLHTEEHGCSILNCPRFSGFRYRLLSRFVRKLPKIYLFCQITRLFGEMGIVVMGFRTSLTGEVSIRLTCATQKILLYTYLSCHVFWTSSDMCKCLSATSVCGRVFHCVRVYSLYFVT